MPQRYLQNFAPRWIIFLCDLVLITVALGLSFFIIHRLSLDMPQIMSFLPPMGMNLLVGTFCISVLGTYKGIIRYSEIRDVIRIIQFGFLQLGCWAVICLLFPHATATYAVAMPLLLINLAVVVFLLVSFRLLVKEVYFRANQVKSDPGQRILIFGAGMMGQVTKKVLEHDPSIKATLVGFIDDSYYKVGKKIEGLPIYSAADPQLSKIIRDHRITQIYIAINKLAVERKIALTDALAPFKVKINVVPHVNQWSGGLFQKNQVRELNIEELLQRDEIVIPNDLSEANYQDATVLVTGAAGSIGSEICRQLIRHNLRKLIILDQSESGLFDLDYELRQKGFSKGIYVEVASVKDQPRMKKIFQFYNPTVVFLSLIHI